MNGLLKLWRRRFSSPEPPPISAYRCTAVIRGVRLKLLTNQTKTWLQKTVIGNL